MKRQILILVGLSILLAPALTAQQSRLLKVDDIFSLKDVSDPRISPDGKWVAYTVSWLNQKDDGSDTDIYMASIEQPDLPPVRLTTSTKSENSPRWSPDGRYLGFLSSRDGEKTQVWLLDRRGGEAHRLTDLKADVSSFVWSPDSTKLALVMSDPDPEEAAGPEGEDKTKTPKPIVIRRRQFKRDGEGYLTDLRTHIYVFEVAAKESVQITTGPYDDSSPVWSPDGQRIVFSSNRTADPDSNENTDLFIVEAMPDQQVRQLTTSAAGDGTPVFTPDGQNVVYIQDGDPKDVWYDTNSLAVVPVTGGQPRSLTKSLDRNVSRPKLSADGRAVLFVLEDGGNDHLARIPLAGGPVECLVAGERSVGPFDVGPNDELVVLESQLLYPAEISLVEKDGSLKRITRVNDEFLRGVRLGPVERFKAKSADGTLIDAFLTRPPDVPAGTKVPAILRIHGGPVSQFSTEFSFEWQILAAHGYGVIAANPRGSSGRGREFSRAIFADWGNKDFEDVMAAVDHVVAMGVADPNRLGVGGWSYGGILTNYVITKTDRFKAAISGASEVNYLADYGTDHYQLQWEGELGLPWRSTELWIKLSPWFKVESIVTPTLIMCGDKDMNVPLLNSEQLYQALKRLGKETELVIYPGQTHGIRRPSFQKDRYERYLAWYDRYLKPKTSSH